MDSLLIVIQWQHIMNVQGNVLHFFSEQSDLIFIRNSVLITQQKNCPLLIRYYENKGEIGIIFCM